MGNRRYVRVKLLNDVAGGFSPRFISAFAITELRRHPRGQTYNVDWGLVTR